MVMIFVILTLVFPRKAKFAYDYKKGSPWSHETLLAQFDFPILKTDEQLREERSKNKSAVIPYYRFRQDIVDNSLSAVGSMELGKYSSFRPQLVSVLESIFSRGVVSDEGVKLDKGADPSSAVIYIQKDKRAVKRPASEVYMESEARAKLMSDVASKHPRVNVDSVLRAEKVYDLVVPNLDYDSRTTDLVNSEASSRISTTLGFVNAGQLIISEGDIVTSEIAQILDSYKVEYEENMGYGGPKIFFWLGNALMAFVITVLFFLVIYFLNKRIFKDTRRFWYLVLVLLISALTTVIANKFFPKFMYMVPFTLTALYLEAFFKNKMILPLCVVSFMPLLIFPDNGVVLFVMFIVASVVAVFAFKFFNQGWRQFITAAIVFVSLLVTYFGFRLIGKVSDDPYQAILFLFIGSMLNVAGYPLIYLFEKMFGMTTNLTLMELSSTGHKALRELSRRAPGTFQHSVQVANIAEDLVNELGGDALLAKVGALYHDIGKVCNPLYFTENQNAGFNPHDELDYAESAQIITRHVTDGLELARRYHLPAAVQDFIRTHHGTTHTGYFYAKEMERHPDGDFDAALFRYPGPRPYSRETAVVMIVDTVEAACRSLKQHTKENTDALIDRLVDGKIREGQLDNCALSLGDIALIRRFLKEKMMSIYHVRVEYPTVKG